ncbi:hypothetical protein DES53_10872 [Roseimicrobium gellanilyticum]|uniref:Uncharacterized protein n=1 Tax=Roseimicrobium gellanilyticum TaxID=748857 RepID=A0A366HEW2_9BACT|nr:hypothetical protein [Roseimicrobium gellanilyticum]RBP40365.1 hypothetical protein DES53_10872 [Roseimicrobium gellanilyticum]
MPLDEIAGGCVEVIFRFLLEVLGEGFLRLLWAICQYTGAVMVWVCTFGQVWPLYRHEHLAGAAGLLAYALLTWWLVRTF